MSYEYAITNGTILRHSSVLGWESNYTIEDVLRQCGFGITYLASSTISVSNTEYKLYFAIKEFSIKDQCWREHSFRKCKDNLFAKLLSSIVQKRGGYVFSEGLAGVKKDGKWGLVDNLE